MAPEQIQISQVTPQTDIYALGRNSLRNVYWEKPFSGNSAPSLGPQNGRIKWEQQYRIPTTSLIIQAVPQF
jgi:serine/threonine protein kinase